MWTKDPYSEFRTPPELRGNPCPCRLELPAAVTYTLTRTGVITLYAVLNHVVITPWMGAGRAPPTLVAPGRELPPPPDLLPGRTPMRACRTTSRIRYICSNETSCSKSATRTSCNRKWRLCKLCRTHNTEKHCIAYLWASTWLAWGFREYLFWIFKP